MTDYRIIYEDPNRPDLPACIITPAPEWMEKAKAGELPKINIWLDLMDDEQKAIDEGRLSSFEHDFDKWERQFTGPKTGPLTEEEAITYLIMKDVPRSVWSKQHNRCMLRVMKAQNIPKNRSFRNAWEIEQ